MIKINLSTARKPLDLTNVGGFDFSKVKVKALLLVIVLIYVPDLVIIPMWEAAREQKNQELSSKQEDLNKLKLEVAHSKTLEQQIVELKAQEESLGQKLIAVKKAISEKRNPSALLLFIAKNIPDELWIKELVIENDDMVIKGEAMDYTSIGNFVNNLRSSVFIRDANIASTNSTVRESDKKRIESFEVKFLLGSLNQ